MTTERGTSVAGMVTVAMGLAVAALPTFLVGGLAVQIRQDLGFGEAGLGAAVTTAFLAGALAAPAAGPVTDRLGARRSIAFGTSLSGVSLLGVAMLARGWFTLTAFLVVGGLAIAVTDPALAVLVSRAMPPHRHGLAFGVKEASIPFATLISGLAVPAVALTVGWRWAFAAGLVPLLVLLWMVSRLDVDRLSEDDTTGPVPVDPEVSTPRPDRTGLFLVAAAAGLGSAAASGVGVFLTESGVAMGLAPASAGLLLATASLAGIVARVTAGAVADRRGGGHLRLMAGMLAVGAIAMAAGSIGTAPFLLVGAIGAFTGAWGWSGLLFLSLVRASPSSPGAAAGVGLAGLGIGNALGPLGFGLIAQSASFHTAWLAAATAAALAAGVVLLARDRL